MGKSDEIQLSKLENKEMSNSRRAYPHETELLYFFIASLWMSLSCCIFYSKVPGKSQEKGSFFSLLLKAFYLKFSTSSSALFFIFSPSFFLLFLFLSLPLKGLLILCFRDFTFLRFFRLHPFLLWEQRAGRYVQG